jgi:branched-chain amino acid transport system ATP-binding protein
MTALLEAEGIDLAYGQVTACRDITFHVEEGEVVTLIGANGAGPCGRSPVHSFHARA